MYFFHIIEIVKSTLFDNEDKLKGTNRSVFWTLAHYIWTNLEPKKHGNWLEMCGHTYLFTRAVVSYCGFFSALTTNINLKILHRLSNLKPFNFIKSLRATGKRTMKFAAPWACSPSGLAVVMKWNASPTSLKQIGRWIQTTGQEAHSRVAGANGVGARGKLPQRCPMVSRGCKISRTTLMRDAWI